MEDYTTGTGQRIRVHDKEKCQGEYCCVHNPSSHHMREWKTHWRNDRGIMERICPEHGVGHPDPDDLAFHIRMEPDKNKHKYKGIHGCCGCCSLKEEEKC